MNNKANPTNPGTVVSVRGSVVDIRFDEHLPPIYSVLRAGAEKKIVIEVLAQRDARHVRGIALTPKQGLPLFHTQPEQFIDMMRHGIALNGSFFNTHRMMQQYVLKAYFE